ncbi:HMG box protein [Diplocarpon rosae]|nr:HMG box protein [Diplocarpon rosae]
MSNSLPPPPIDGELTEHGLHHIIEHNSNTSYPREQHYNEELYLQSQYGSPAPQQDDGYHYGQQPRYTYQQHLDSGSGNRYDSYSGQMYQDHYSTPATSPPTPSMSSREMRTRNGLGIGRASQNLRPMPEGRPRVVKSPKPKKTRAVKTKAEKKIAKLEKPLSELTKDWGHLPIVDIEAYVNRSAEERRREVETGKVPGKVKRPMNSFMLYRKAYQGRTKDWCLQNNHQIVSQVCGDSWPLEPEHIKEQYSEWARVERANHQNAHPGYKFSPTKPGASKVSKRKVSEEPLTEESDLDDFEWQANNPGRPMPMPYSQNLRQGEYYRQIINNNQNLPNTEDVVLRKATTPGPHSYLGLPGGHEYDMMHYQQYQESLAPEQRIDSSLIPQDLGGNFHGAGHPSMYYSASQNSDHPWETPFAAHEQDPNMPFIDPTLSLEGSQIHDPHAHILRGTQENWHVETLEEEDQFNKWMDGA